MKRVLIMGGTVGDTGSRCCCTVSGSSRWGQGGWGGACGLRRTGRREGVGGVGVVVMVVVVGLGAGED